LPNEIELLAKSLLFLDSGLHFFVLLPKVALSENLFLAFEQIILFVEGFIVETIVITFLQPLEQLWFQLLDVDAVQRTCYQILSSSVHLLMFLLLGLRFHHHLLCRGLDVRILTMVRWLFYNFRLYDKVFGDLLLNLVDGIGIHIVTLSLGWFGGYVWQQPARNGIILITLLFVSHVHKVLHTRSIFFQNLLLALGFRTYRRLQRFQYDGVALDISFNRPFDFEMFELTDILVV
jgi:hypothetical protein